VKNVKTSFCNLVLTLFCTLLQKHVLNLEEVPGNPERKPAAKKTPNRAGATPLFRLSAAQKVFRGRSRPPAQNSVPGVFFAAQS
jgi:hypothetical protein